MSTQILESAAQDNSIYTGCWINWSRGPIVGATLTLSHRHGGFLLAFIALFVTISGASFWSILSCIIHQASSSKDSQHAIYHQRQAVFRNTHSSGSALWKFMWLSWAWRRQKRAVLRGLLPSLLLSCATLSAFSLAGVFSSWISTSSEVLVLGNNCGIFDGLLGETGPSDAYMGSRMQFDLNYALSCYSNSTFAADCPTFVEQRLPITTTDISCPFPGQNAICRNGSTGIRIDSGYLNSHFDLGINMPPENRFLYRSFWDCAPLLHEPYTHPANATLDQPNKTALPLVNIMFGNNSGYGNATYQYSADPPFVGPGTISPNNSGNYHYAILDYVLYAVTNFAPPQGVIAEPLESLWNPIPELQIADGDVNVQFLSSNDIEFLNPVQDLWYFAPKFGGNETIARSGAQLVDYYVRADPVRAIGCIERYQFCNPNLPANSSCTPVGGIQQVVDTGLELYQNEEQRAIFNWSATAIETTAAGIEEVVDLLGITSLLSRSSLNSGLQSPLPDNQWQLEMEGWFKITMADLQRTILEQATGPTEAIMRQNTLPPSTKGELKACASQKVRDDSFTSFSILGMIVIFSIGGSLILISIALPLISKRVQRLRYPSREWITNDFLHLQRLAHEAVGAGTWKGTCTNYPTTEKDELLAVLDITDPSHPKLEGSVLRIENVEKESQISESEDGSSQSEVEVLPELV